MTSGFKKVLSVFTVVFTLFVFNATVLSSGAVGSQTEMKKKPAPADASHSGVSEGNSADAGKAHGSEGECEKCHEKKDKMAGHCEKCHPKKGVKVHKCENCNGCDGDKCAECPDCKKAEEAAKATT